jgi:hypothetical protein
MTKMTTAAPSFSNDVDLYPDIPKKWGLGFMIDTAKTPEGRSAGSMAWAGLANTYYINARLFMQSSGGGGEMAEDRLGCGARLLAQLLQERAR